MSAAYSRSSMKSKQPPPSARHARPRAPEPSEPHGSGLQVRICSSSSCLSWLHLLKSWSLRQSRGGSVYGADDTQIGSIERVMIDKRSGKVSYAVLSFGGFLGIGDDHYPLPWNSLKYDTNLGGYRTGITEQQLQGAPKYGNDNEWSWEDQTRTRAVNDYYGVIPI